MLVMNNQDKTIANRTYVTLLPSYTPMTENNSANRITDCVQTSSAPQSVLFWSKNGVYLIPSGVEVRTTIIELIP